MKKKLKLNNSFIPVNKPVIFNDEKKLVNECLQTGWISSEGKFVKQFENNFAKFNSRKFGITVSNGTAALEVALKSLNLKRGAEVIIPTFSIISTALCVVKLNLKPILVDCDIENWNMKIDSILTKITKKTKAIILTHIYGYPVDMIKIIKIAKKENIKIIEDAAEMIGQKYRGKMCGSFGDISTFSFYANKHITTGEGGMILTNNPEISNKCKSLRNLCFGQGYKRFYHDDIGWNYRLSNVQAAIGCGQLKNIKWIVKRKKEIGRLYFKNLKDNKSLFIQSPNNKYAENIYWVFGIVLNKTSKLSRDDLVKKLLKYNIQTRNFFIPMHSQPVFKKLKIFKNNNYPCSEYISKNGFYLPSGLALKNTEINYICRILNSITL